MKITKKISVILPAYNEDENLKVLIPEIDKVLSGICINYEIIVVDDCSSDNTGNVLLNMSEWFLNLKIVRLNSRMGQSFAVWEGIKKSSGDILITKDSDLQTSPHDIPKMINSLNGFDMVCGVRANRDDSVVRKMSSIVANKVRMIVLGSEIIDSACGFKAFNSSCMDSVGFFDGMHRFMPDLFLINGFSVKQVKISHNRRRFGNAKYNIRNRLLKSSSDLIRVWFIKKNNSNR